MRWKIGEGGGKGGRKIFISTIHDRADEEPGSITGLTSQTVLHACL